MAGQAPVHEQEASGTPFALRQYRLSAWARANHSELVADADAQAAKDTDENANNYMLAVVLFASSLFFAGISSKLEIRGMRAYLLALGWLIFLGTVVWLATLPVQLTT